MTPLAIFLASNDAYACFAATAMMSIAEHTESPVHFHLFDDGIRPARRRKIARAIAGHRHATLTLHVDLDRRLDACVNDWYRTRAIFARYFIADRFPEHAMSLYVDVDTIFLDDVAELFALGTGDHGLAACHDMAVHKMVDVERHKSRLGIASEHDYFNNGMILIDGPFWRRNQLSEQLTQTAIEHRGRVTFPSQDPMNIAFSSNRYRSLPQRWNVMPSAGEPVANPAMLHFTLTKPWEETSSPEADRFWEVARRSPFAREIAWKREFWRFVRKPVRRVRSALHRWTGLRR